MRGRSPTDACAACHLETGDERLAAPARNFDADIHKAKGFGCVDCHGGDSRAAGMEAMDPRKGFIGKPSRLQIVQVCGRCHSDAAFMKRYNPSLRVDQVTEYASSVHGRRLRELGDRQGGDLRELPSGPRDSATIRPAVERTSAPRRRYVR